MTKRYKKDKNIKIKPYILIIVTVFLIGTLIYSGYHIVEWKINNDKNKKIKEEVSKSVIINDVENKEQMNINFNELKQQNSDIIAWLKVNNTQIDYPVVKGTDNDYYMTHNFEKEYNKAGWIFADYKNKFNYTDWNIVIYGHNMKSDLMFGTLKNVLNKEWYENEENKFITLTTVDGIWKFEVFSVYEEKASDYPIQTDFKSDSKYLEFIKNIKSKSIYDFNVDVSATTGILTLSTCGSDSSNRIVVHAKKVN